MELYRLHPQPTFLKHNIKRGPLVFIQYHPGMQITGLAL